MTVRLPASPKFPTEAASGSSFRAPEALIKIRPRPNLRDRLSEPILRRKRRREATRGRGFARSRATRHCQPAQCIEFPASLRSRHGLVLPRGQCAAVRRLGGVAQDGRAASSTTRRCSTRRPCGQPGDVAADTLVLRVGLTVALSTAATAAAASSVSAHTGRRGPSADQGEVVAGRWRTPLATAGEPGSQTARRRRNASARRRRRNASPIPRQDAPRRVISA